MYNINIRNLITKELEVKKVNNIIDEFLNNDLQILALNAYFKKLESITNEKGEKLNFTYDFNKNIWIESLL